MGNNIQFKKTFLSHESKPDYLPFFRDNFSPTLFYFLTFTIFGMCIGIMGPSMPHLQCQINASESTMSMVFFLQLAAMLIGTLASGSIIKLIDPHLLMVINCLMLVVNTYLVMTARSSSVLAIILVIMGLNMGCIDNLGNVLLVSLYKMNIGPFIQIMHFLYGLGALITQLSIDPFLQYLSTNCSSTTSSDPEKSDELYNAKIKTLSYPFWIIGTIELFIFIVLVQVYKIIQKKEIKPNVDFKSSIKEISDVIGPEGAKIKSRKYLHGGIIILVAGLCFILDGMQSEYNSFVYKYALKFGRTDLERSYASFLGFTFWGTLAIGRFAAILISFWCRISALLIIDVMGLFLGVVLLVCGQGHNKVVYVSTCIIGLTLSNTTPGVISLAEEFINLTKWRTTFVIFSASAGEAFLPLIFGTLMDNIGPIVFPVGNVILVILIIGNFFTLFKLGATTSKFTEKYIKSVAEAPKTDDGINVKHYSRVDSVELL